MWLCDTISIYELMPSLQELSSFDKRKKPCFITPTNNEIHTEINLLAVNSMTSHPVTVHLLVILLLNTAAVNLKWRAEFHIYLWKIYRINPLKIWNIITTTPTTFTFFVQKLLGAASDDYRSRSLELIPNVGPEFSCCWVGEICCCDHLCAWKGKKYYQNSSQIFFLVGQITIFGTLFRLNKPKRAGKQEKQLQSPDQQNGPVKVFC